MSDEDQPHTPTLSPDEPLLVPDVAPAAKPKVKKRRLLLLLIPLAFLAAVSTLFGMMMAVASDLPELESAKEFQTARNSLLFDTNGKPLGVLTTDQDRVLVSYGQISSFMRNAIIAIEDKRFYENSGVDLRGIGRAFYQDIVHGGSVQGGSTIAQQFVKNALQAQNKRTIFEKLKESALAYHLTRKWSKQKILTEYLNSIYFGNGAYGVESAARVYFGHDPNHLGCGTRARPCAAELTAPEAALIAGIVANPSAFDPLAHPLAAKRRRDLVLKQMLLQGYMSQSEYTNGIEQTLPTNIVPPSVDSKAPYFTTWVSQQLVEHFGARKALEGGLSVKTTLDLDLQRAAAKAIQDNLGGLGPNGPAAALVAIDNQTGEVRALVGGTDYRTQPFNLATQGQRQPGSTVKPFILAQALKKGYGLGSIWESRKRVFDVPGSGGQEKFVVNNFDNAYAGARDLGSALTYSDNAVFAAVGIATGTKRIAHFIERMGVRTPVSSNPAMTLGAFKQGVSALDWAHAYESFAADGNRVWGSLGAPDQGPVGIEEVRPIGSQKVIARDKIYRTRVLSPDIAQLTTQQMETVVAHGTGTRAAYGGFAAGKTGTTENFGDAWFAGFTDRWTIAVWVGYPNSNKPMLTEFGGQPVAGGTYPAQIWHDFVVQANAIYKERAAAAAAKKNGTTPPPSVDPSTLVGASGAPATSGTVTGGGTTGAGTTGAGTGGHKKGGGTSPAGGTGGGGGSTGTGKTGAGGNATPAPAPAPAPSTPPAAGGDSGGAAAPSG
ncbi:MAG TPA: transglycosylase domain-containing protein [Solirubrobacteraceae bacterium]|nr:transglycosylase domain-containing protein [Solirubrobacteraceae bacterium]